MTKKQQKHPLPIEKTLSYIGISLVALGVIANLYYGFANQLFLETLPLHGIYYMNYFILLAGGFAAGYFMTPKAVRSHKVYVGSGYALAAYLVFLLIDVIRLLVRPLLSTTPGVIPGFPGTVEGALFSFSPVIALAVTIVAAFVFQRLPRTAALTPASMRAFVVTFLLAEMYFTAQLVYFSATASSGDSYASPLWLTIASYATNPFVVALVTFLLLGNVRSLLTRLFYAVFIATSLTLFTQLLWNFNTNPSAEWATSFQTGVLLALAGTYAAVMAKIRRDTSPR